MRIKWSRLLVNPRTRILSRDGATTRVAVDGLVCDRVCAARTGRALHRLPGVQEVHVDYDAGVATIVGQPHDALTYERAVTGAVAGRSLRRVLERAATILRRAAPRRQVASR